MPEGTRFKAGGLALGAGPSALEVLVATSESEPALPALRSAWKTRKGGRATPILLVVLYGDKAALCLWKLPCGNDRPRWARRLFQGRI